MEFKTKIVKNGNSFGLAIPKALIDCKVLEKNKYYKVKLESYDNEDKIKNAVYEILSRELIPCSI